MLEICLGWLLLITHSPTASVAALTEQFLFFIGYIFSKTAFVVATWQYSFVLSGVFCINSFPSLPGYLSAQNCILFLLPVGVCGTTSLGLAVVWLCCHIHHFIPFFCLAITVVAFPRVMARREGYSARRFAAWLGPLAVRCWCTVAKSCQGFQRGHECSVVPGGCCWHTGSPCVHHPCV